ncbi:MAG: MBL fold metallo-hydrolase [Rhodoferax sp.]|nr:MBL fold metallo-hydrolase [Rhodoferax sp.]
MVARQVSPSAWYVQGLSAVGSSANQNFISNAGFVVTPAGVLVIDALGSPALATRLLAEIAKVTALPVTHVIVTHYHADHIFGLQVFQALGARVVAHRGALAYLNSDAARQRLAVSRQDLAPWVDEQTRLVQPDLWLDGPHELLLGGTRIQIKPLGPAHTPEDLAVYLPEDKVLYTGDLVFRGRLPFVGQADSRRWIGALDELLALGPTAMVPGHGAPSTTPRQDMQLTRDYLLYLRSVMAQAAKNLEPFEQAYDAADWSRFERVPMFGIVNRMNAYNTYLLLEREGN